MKTNEFLNKKGKIMIFIILFFLGLMQGLSIFLKATNSIIDIPKVYPFSIYFFKINWAGLPYMIIFLAIGIFIVKKSSKIPFSALYVLCLLLLIFGNLIQGGPTLGLEFPYNGLDPKTNNAYEYFHDALKIENPKEWLATFSEMKLSYLPHTRTHPPFSVLIHYWIYKWIGQSVLGLSMAFLLIYSVNFFLIKEILTLLKTNIESQKSLLSLFFVIPAVNIYGIGGLDSIIVTFFTTYLLGLFLVLQEKRIGVLLMVIGFTISSLLTFGSMFLVGLSVLVLALNLKSFKKLVVAYLILAIVFVFVSIFLNKFYNYNHFESFIQASILENRAGYRLFINTTYFTLSRIENIFDIVVLLNPLILVIGLTHKKLNFKNLNIRIFISGMLTLLLIFATGAYKTGETARAMLFIFPYFLLTLIECTKQTLNTLFLTTLTFCALLQFSGSFFW